MKKRILIVLMIVTLFVCLIVLSGCTEKKEENNITNEGNEIVNDIENLDDLAKVEVEKGLFDVELTIPATYIGDKTQEELTATAQENGYKSITLNEDGSATYIMTKSQHKKLLKNMKKSFDEGLDELIGSEEYPSLKKIETNDNYTEFTITTTSTELNLTESFSVMAFYMYGGMYSVFSGEAVDNVHVKFVNDVTGEIISEANSNEMSN